MEMSCRSSCGHGGLEFSSETENCEASDPEGNQIIEKDRVTPRVRKMTRKSRTEPQAFKDG